MGSGGKNPLTQARAFIAAAWPKHAAKHLEQHLGCSRRTATRIASTGHVPAALAPILLPVLDKALSAGADLMVRLSQEIKALDHEEMVARSRARRDDAVNASWSSVTRLADGSKNPSLKE